ncbi:hypothetical protein [uncultured Methanocorpusculum sp.]|nr:hypothetical protein [uncultured Methanocorpusculum sp.]
MTTNTDEIVGTWHADQEYYDLGAYFNLKYVFVSDGTVTEFWYDANDGTLQKQFDLFWNKDDEGEYTLTDGKDYRRYMISDDKLCDVDFLLYYHRE